MKKIGLTGSHSVGKTTLIEEFIKLNPDYTPVTQQIRRFVAKHDIKDLYNERSETLQFMYLYNHLMEINELDKFITDRTTIDNFAYYLELNDDKYHDIYRSIVEESLSNYDVICYIPIEFELEEDGFRFDGNMQSRIDDIILDILEDFEIDYVTISGTVEERLEKLNNVLRD